MLFDLLTAKVGCAEAAVVYYRKLIESSIFESTVSYVTHCQAETRATGGDQHAYLRLVEGATTWEGYLHTVSPLSAIITSASFFKRK